MAKPKGTGTSSYERINLALSGTSEFKEYEESFKRLIKSTRVDGLTYEELSMSSSPDGMPEARFEVAVGDARIKDLRFKDPESARLNIDFIVTPPSLANVLDTFGEGKKVRTFYCKKDAVEQRFLTHARAHLADKNAGLIEEARIRLSRQAQSMLDSGHVQEGRIVAYENEAVEEIRKVLLKFRNIRRPALKRAIDEFIVHDVTET